MPHRRPVTRSAAVVVLLLMLSALFVGCATPRVKYTTRRANVYVTTEPGEVELLEYIDSATAEYDDSYNAEAVLVDVADSYAAAGYTDVVILVDVQRRPGDAGWVVREHVFESDYVGGIPATE